ncbi:MAG: hypothetical protein HY302_08520 [Opitutae bacterium]|nr:hypothetical protein [Opitutae bacterium]
MQTLTASMAKASFSRLTRSVLKTRERVVVSIRERLVQIAPNDLSEEVSPAPPGSLKHTARETELSNTFGETR